MGFGGSGASGCSMPGDSVVSVNTSLHRLHGMSRLKAIHASYPNTQPTTPAANTASSHHRVFRCRATQLPTTSPASVPTALVDGFSMFLQ